MTDKHHFTVAELRKHLAEIPDDLPVMIEIAANLANSAEQYVFESRGGRHVGRDDKVHDSRHLVLGKAIYAFTIREVVTTDGAALIVEANY